MAENKNTVRVLFICLGNICRSVAAEEVFRSLVGRRGLASHYEIDSAGLIDYHEGELADSRMRLHASKRGYALTHRSRPIQASDFERFDYIIAMDADNIRRLRRIAPSEDDMKKVMLMADFLREHKADCVPDPYYGTERDFELVLDLLEDASMALCDFLEGWITEFCER